MSQPRARPATTWGTPTKLVVVLIGLVLLAGLLSRFHAIIPPLVVAGVVTYLALPIVGWIHARARLSWGLATNLVYLALLLQVIAALAALGLAAVQQLQGLFFTVQQFLGTLPERLAEWTRETVLLGPFQLDLSRFDLGPLVDQLLQALQPALGRVSLLLTTLATGALELMATLLFILAVSYFLTMDIARIRSGWEGLAIPGAEEDLRRLRTALSRIWHSFLRGQLLIVLVTGILTAILMTALGVRFSLGLGVLMGFAKFIPIVGPSTAGAVAALVALFQPSNWFGLTPLGHAGLVVICVVVLDQSIDYILLPRIMGTSLNLHPVLVLVGAIVGATLAGIVGLLLSAPATATLLLLTRFAYRKLVDLSPWDPPIDAPPTLRRRITLHRLRAWLRRPGRPA